MNEERSVLPDIGCTIREVGTTTGPNGREVPKFEITANDPKAHRQLIDIVRRDVAKR